MALSKSLKIQGNNFHNECHSIPYIQPQFRYNFLLSPSCIKNKYSSIYRLYARHYITMIFDSSYWKENNVCYKLLEAKKKEKVNTSSHSVLKKAHTHIYHYKSRLLFIRPVYRNNSTPGIQSICLHLNRSLDVCLSSVSIFRTTHTISFIDFDKVVNENKK